MTRSKGNIMVYQIPSSRRFKVFIFVHSLVLLRNLKKGAVSQTSRKLLIRYFRNIRYFNTLIIREPQNKEEIFFGTHVYMSNNIVFVNLLLEIKINLS